MEPLFSGVDFPEIVKCRAVKVTRKMGKEESSYCRKMKKIYALRGEAEMGKSKKSPSFDDFKNRLLSKAQNRQKEVQKMLKEQSPQT